MALAVVGQLVLLSYMPGLTHHQSISSATPLDLQSKTLFYFDHKSMLYGVLLHRECYIKTVTADESTKLGNTQTLEKFEIELLEMALHEHHTKFTFGEVLSKSAGIAHMCSAATEIFDMDQKSAPPRDCHDILMRGSMKSGVYAIHPGGLLHELHVYCDMTSEGGGWLILQRRKDGSVDFFRDWVDYEQGFGSLTGEFWLGNFHLHTITRQTQYELYINMVDVYGNKGYATYDVFTVDDALNKYTLHLSGYHGDRGRVGRYGYLGYRGDSMSRHSGREFSTKDRGNEKNCSLSDKGGWWYFQCASANLNGLYPHSSISLMEDVFWATWDNSRHNLQYTEMRIRPFNRY